MALPAMTKETDKEVVWQAVTKPDKYYVIPDRVCSILVVLVNSVQPIGCDSYDVLKFCVSLRGLFHGFDMVY